jgi:hypothetical protein
LLILCCNYSQNLSAAQESSNKMNDYVKDSEAAFEAQTSALTDRDVFPGQAMIFLFLLTAVFL